MPGTTSADLKLCLPPAAWRAAGSSSGGGAAASSRVIASKPEAVKSRRRRRPSRRPDTSSTAPSMPATIGMTVSISVFFSRPLLSIATIADTLAGVGANVPSNNVVVRWLVIAFSRNIC